MNNAKRSFSWTSEAEAVEGFITSLNLDPLIYTPLIRSGLQALSKAFSVPIVSLQPGSRLGKDIIPPHWQGFDPFQLVLEMEGVLHANLSDDSANVLGKVYDVTVEQWLKCLPELRFRDQHGNEGDWRFLCHSRSTQ